MQTLKNLHHLKGVSVHENYFSILLEIHLQQLINSFMEVETAAIAVAVIIVVLETSLIKTENAVTINY